MQDSVARVQGKKGLQWIIYWPTKNGLVLQYMFH